MFNREQVCCLFNISQSVYRVAWASCGQVLSSWSSTSPSSFRNISKTDYTSYYSTFRLQIPKTEMWHRDVKIVSQANTLWKILLHWSTCRWSLVARRQNLLSSHLILLLTHSQCYLHHNILVCSVNGSLAYGLQAHGVTVSATASKHFSWSTFSFICAAQSADLTIFFIISPQGR